MFDLIAKINAINSFFKLIKSCNKILLLIICLTISLIFCGFFIIKKHYDNSIYIDVIQDEKIVKEIHSILKKCGDKHAISVSVVSTEINSNYYGKFKEFWACDKNFSQDCLMNLILQEKYRSDYNVDFETYKLLKDIAIENETKELNLQTFNIEKYVTIYETLKQSQNFNDINIEKLTFECMCVKRSSIKIKDLLIYIKSFGFNYFFVNAEDFANLNCEKR
jgi:hypothetical protein